MSLITSIIGGIQGASAAKNAAAAQEQGDQAAATTMQGAVTSGQTGVTNAGQAAGAGATTAASLGQFGVTSATGNAGALLNPYQTTGAQATTQLAAGLAPGGDLSQTFTAADMEANDPGYEFRLQQGEQALQRSLAAGGSVMGGGAMKQLNDYAQNSASSEYQNAFNRFTTNQQNNVTNLENTANAGQAAATTGGNQQIQAGEFNSNTGTQAAEYAGTTGLTAATTGAQIGMNGAQYIGNTQIGYGNAQAQGDLGSANAWNGMLSGIGSFANSMLTGGAKSMMSGLKNVFGSGGSGGSPNVYTPSGDTEE